MTSMRILLVVMLLAATAPAVGRQDATPAAEGKAPAASVSVDEAVARGVEFIVAGQEGETEAEWPYEGVYRVRGRIPIGYRVGGSAIAATALITRRAAVRRATAFITGSVDEPLMSHDVQSTYDVRGWGYAYGLGYLLEIVRGDLVPEGLESVVDAAIRFFIAGIEATTIPERGGWNYARRGGFDQPGRASPFMTAPTLQALFDAAREGYDVDADAVRAGLDALERGRTVAGSFVYSGAGGAGRNEKVPGSVGRMLVAEVTLARAGRGSPARIRGALDAFIVHWGWLDKRRAKNGTHKPPYGIAPYYFYFAHRYAAEAAGALPEGDRDEYRRRINDLLFSVRLEDGTWNDRVFARSAVYGTSMALISLTMPDAPEPARWSPDGAAIGAQID